MEYKDDKKIDTSELLDKIKKRINADKALSV
jgi:hypothetical protein